MRRKHTTVRALRRWLFALLVVTISVAAAAPVPTPQPGADLSFGAWGAIIATWIMVLVAVLGLGLTQRRDRQAMQDRVDQRTAEILIATLGSKVWKDDRDQRIKELIGISLLQEFGYDVNLKDRVSKIEASVQALRDDLGGIVQRGVADGVAEAAKRLAEEQVRAGMVMPDRGGRGGHKS
jgi:hypothetical protein